jgi:hypothetical protein
MHYLTIKKFANNHIRVMKHRQPSIRRKQDDNDSIRIGEAHARRVQLATSTEIRSGFAIKTVHNDPGALAPYICTTGEAEVVEEHINAARSYLSSSREFKKEQKNGHESLITAPRRHAARFTPYARQTILEALHLAERWSGGTSRNSLVTLTLPGSISSELLDFAQVTGWIINRLLQAVRDSKLAVRWLYVWEYQKRGALHLHISLSSQRDGESQRVGNLLVAKWRCLLREVKEKFGIDTISRGRDGGVWDEKYWRNRSEVVQKSLASYLSKYLSKGTKEKDEKGQPLPAPSRWWGYSRELARDVRAARVVVRIPVTEAEADEGYNELKKTLQAYEPTIERERSFEVENYDGLSLVAGSQYLAYFAFNFERRVTWILSGLSRAVERLNLTARLEGQVGKFLSGCGYQPVYNWY